MPELQLVLDTQLVLIGNGMSNIERTTAHVQLLAHFDDSAFLALDNERQIRTEYERKMGADSEGRKWLAKLAVHDRIRMFDLAAVPRKLKVEMDKAHFHPSDRKFTRLAMATASKCLVAEESDYSKAVIKVLSKHAGITVHTAESVCTMIASRKTDDPPADLPPPA